MSNLVRLDRLSDLGDDLGRGQLQDTLELMAAALRRQQQLLEQVKEADKIVAPVPIEAFPTAAGQIYTGREGGEIGDVVWRAVQEAPVGTLLCDGSEVSRTTYSDLFDKMTNAQMASFESKLEKLRDALVFAQDEADPVEACGRLRKEFGDDFPIPEKSSTGRTTSRAISSSGSAA